jgi:PAS domain S-box-containing protein
MPHRPPHALFSPRAERALVEVSRRLVSRSDVDLPNVLGIVGRLLNATCAFLAFADEPQPPTPLDRPADDLFEFGSTARSLPQGLAGRVLQWSREGSEPPCPPAYIDSALRSVAPGQAHGVCLLHRSGTTSAFAVPLLADDNGFVGFLGLEHEQAETTVPRDDAAVLTIVGDLLSAHLSRLAAEEAGRQSQERWQRLVVRHPDPIVVTVRDAITYANVAAARLFGADDTSMLRAFRLQDFFAADTEGELHELRDAQLAAAEPRPFEHAILRLDGEERIVESVSVPFPGLDDAVQTVLRDITDRRESEERYRTFVETISEGVWRVELDHPMPTLIPGSAQVEHVLCHGRLAEYNAAMERLFWSAAPPPLGIPIETVLADHGPSFVRAFVNAGYQLHNHEIMISANRPSGPRYFSINAVARFEQDALVGVWGSVTEITDRVQMERSMVAALEEQQERIGRDLHDSVGQLLTGVRMLSENLAARYADTDAAPTAARVVTYATEALDRVRTICRGLVPPQLYDEGAAAALAELVSHIDALGLVQCAFRHDGRADLTDPESSLQFYRILQEATTNALKHAQARHIWVYFGYDDDDIVLEIEDDGVGFAYDRDRAHSIGLYSMHRRANSVGGRLAVETQPGAGTTIRVSLNTAARASRTPQEALAPAA